jgi:hypothetical protein
MSALQGLRNYGDLDIEMWASRNINIEKKYGDEGGKEKLGNVITVSHASYIWLITMGIEMLVEKPEGMRAPLQTSGSRDSSVSIVS